MISFRPPGPYSFDPPTDGLRARATGGIVKTGLSQAIRLVVQFASVVLLSRLLLPAEFGLVAMAAPVAAFAALFQDLGLSQAVVQKRSLTQQEVSGLFWINVGISATLALLLVLISPLVALFYHEPRVAPLTAAMGANVLCGGVGALHYALLNRRMRFGVLAIIDATAAIGSLSVSAGVALATHSFWALFAGTLAGSLIPTAGFWLASGWLPSRPSLQSEVRTALQFGANVTGFNLANFFARNLDNVLIGRVWGERSLGVYDRAYKLLLMPLQQINNPIAKVMLPLLAQLANQPDRYRAAFLRTLSQMLLITLPGVAFLVGDAHLLVPILLGPQWKDASPIFAALGMAGFLQALNNPTGWLFMSQNRSKSYMWWGVFGSVTSLASFVIGLPYGPFGVAVCYAASEYLRTPILWWYVTRSGPIRLAHIVRAALPHFCGAMLSLATVLLLREVLSSGAALVFSLSLLASYAATGLTLMAFEAGRTTIMESVELLQKISTRLIPAH